MTTSALSPSPATRLRALIEAPEILVLPGVFDGFSTRLVSTFGYTAAFITGSGVSETRLGQPDVGLMGLDENVAAARSMAACSSPTSISKTSQSTSRSKPFSATRRR